LEEKSAYGKTVTEMEEYITGLCCSNAFTVILSSVRVVSAIICVVPDMQVNRHKNGNNNRIMFCLQPTPFKVVLIFKNFVPPGRECDDCFAFCEISLL
jgi:hypothetical protein